MEKLVTAIFSFILVGCATSSPVATLDISTPEVARFDGASPAIGTPSTANVGEQIFEEFSYLAEKHPDYFSVNQNIDLTVGPMMHVVLTPSTRLYQTTEHKFCVPNYGNDCLYDENADGKFERASSRPGMIEFDKPLVDPVSYEKQVGETKIVEDQNGFKRQLIYQGRDGATLRIRYMEFVDNLARPAFTQDLTYPITRTGASTVVFKNLKIRVDKVMDTGISYTVLSNEF